MTDQLGKKMPSDLEVYVNPSNDKKKLAPSFSSMEEYINNGLILCGQDMILDVLTRHLERQNPRFRSLRSYVGSIDGLHDLYYRRASVAAAHLWDGETEEYNVPYVRRLLPGQRAVVINLCYRMQGFYVAPNNPKNIKDWKDLLREDVQFVNCQKGSGTRVLLDEQLRKLDIDCQQIRGYEKEEISHIALARAVARGLADVGLGIETAALQRSEVDFIPLKKESYDLIIYKQDIQKPFFQLLLSVLKSDEFLEELKGFGGYDLSKTGEVMGQT